MAGLGAANLQFNCTFSESDDNPKARLSQDAFVSSTISLALPLAMTSLPQMEKYSSNYELNCAADLCAEILIGLVKWLVNGTKWKFIYYN